MTITAHQILASAPARFRPEKAADLNTTFYFTITGDENFEVFIKINNGTCQLTESFDGAANCVIKTSAKTYVELETGAINPQIAFMSGQIEVSNLSEMMKFAKCFRKFDATVYSNRSNEQKIRPIKNGPLHGVQILDFTRLLPGPMATMMLADMGADVIKIEDPDSPDYIRSFEPSINGTSAFYYALNRNKRSLAINFLSPAGKEIILQLVKNADVLIEQYRPGIMHKFGLDYTALSTINTRLIYISITGYGQNSSLSLAAGHDINYIAIAGALGITYNDDGEPVIPGFQLADIAGGSYTTMNAVTAALYQREKTGRGEYIDIAMTDCVLPFISLPYAAHQASNKLTKEKFQLSGSQANYNVYKCSDGKYVALGSLEPKFWNAVCQKLGKPEWQEKIIDDASTQQIIRTELQQTFFQKTREEWIAFFAKDDICLTPINSLNEIGTDKYLNEKNLFVDFKIGEKEIKTIGQPIKFKSQPQSDNWIAPQLGEDTYTILKELNVSDENINSLSTDKIIKVL